jgi:hypothetical protein
VAKVSSNEKQVTKMKEKRRGEAEKKNRSKNRIK